MKIVFVPLLAILICFSKPCYSQYHYDDRNFVIELGGGLGAMYCLSDLGGANSDTKLYLNEFKVKNTRLSGSLFAGVLYKSLVGARLEATWGQVRAADADISSTSSLNLITKANRNLTFKSAISEVALLGEFYPLTLWVGDNEEPSAFAPYIAAGVGRFTFNPQTLYQGQWVDLKNLHTEGQGFEEYKETRPYNTTQFNIPLGLGLRYEVSPTVHLRLEFLHRLLFTDYLDDVSSRGYVNPAVFAKYLSPVAAAYATALYNPSKNGKLPARRGNPDNKDAYMTLSVKLGITL